MPATPHWGHPFPSDGDVPDVPADLEALALSLDDVTKYAQGPAADRPPSTLQQPGKRGRLYFATDEGVLYLDTGTAWTAVQPALVTDGPANVGTLRTLGTGAQQAAAGNDPRLSDARTPLDGSVTAAKVASTLKPSEGAGNGVEALRAIGTGPGQVAAGSDARFPTADQKAGLEGHVAPPTSQNKVLTRDVYGAGHVSATGVADIGQHRFSAQKTGLGEYRVTFNPQLPSTSFTVTVTPGGWRVLAVTNVSRTGFNVTSWTPDTGAGADSDFWFHVLPV